MLTQAQVDAGTAILSSGKLTSQTVDELVSGFRMFFGDLETRYGYDWRTKLIALDDTSDTAKTAGQCAGCFILMQSLGFGVAAMDGGSDAIKYKEKDEYWQYVMYIHTKFYTVPVELSQYSIGRQQAAGVHSSAVSNVRTEPRAMDFFSERAYRRRSRRFW